MSIFGFETRERAYHVLVNSNTLVFLLTECMLFCINLIVLS